jgi:succinate dehydrogenase hydrophobic anchor subunit
MNFEYIMWMFTRLSGLMILLVALAGMIGAFIMGARLHLDVGAVMRWTFFPNSWHVVNSELPDIQPWVNMYWQVMQSLIIAFGVTHGCNGLRVVLEDYMGRTVIRPLARGFIFLVWLFLLFVAYSIIWFDLAV